MKTRFVVLLSGLLLLGVNLALAGALPGTAHGNGAKSFTLPRKYQAASGTSAVEWAFATSSKNLTTPNNKTSTSGVPTSVLGS